MIYVNNEFIEFTKPNKSQSRLQFNTQCPNIKRSDSFKNSIFSSIRGFIEKYHLY